MNSRERPFIREMVLGAVSALGSPTTNTEVCQWIRERYPGTNKGSIQRGLIMCCVNQPSRIHYPENNKPRRATDPRYDFLFRPSRGRVELYDPQRHGNWIIAEHGSGNLVVCKEGEDLELDFSLDVGHDPRPDPQLDGLAVPLLPSQIEAAGWLHKMLPGWTMTDCAFRQLADAFHGFGPEAALLKATVIDRLYSANVRAIVPMAEHIVAVMENPPEDPVALVEEIARIPSVNRNFYSFASKFAHFFINGARFPIYDSYARSMVACHLGKGEADSYRAFVEDIRELQEVAEMSCSLRKLDYYLWLAGNFRKWRAKGDIGAEVRGLFESTAPEVRAHIEALAPNC